LNGLRSRSLHATIARAVAGLFSAAGLLVPPPQAAFYVYPDFEPWREHLRREHGVTTGAGLARHLLEHYGTGVLPASAFGEDDGALRVRVATGLLYGESDRAGGLRSGFAAMDRRGARPDHRHPGRFGAQRRLSSPSARPFVIRA
jgi:aspartate aminotransferase